MGRFLRGESARDWPALVGRPVADAVAVIGRDCPHHSIDVVREGDIEREDYCPTRVTVHHTNDIVTTMPTVG